MSNHCTYMYFAPFKAKTIYNPKPLRFTCHYHNHTHLVFADGRYEARAMAAKHFKVGPDKIIAVRA
jgi:hypothetical protein